MIFLWIGLCVVLLSITYLLNKDIAHPVVVSGGIWLAVYVMLMLVLDNGETQNLYYGSFALSYFFFWLGFYLFSPKKIGRKEVAYAIEWKPRIRNVIFIVEYVLVVYWMIECSDYLDASSLWQSIRRNSDDLVHLTSGILGVIRNMIPIVFFTSFGMYLCNPNKRNRTSVILSIPPMLTTMLFSSRGDWFYILITSVFMVLYIKRLENAKIMKYGIVGVATILIVFVISSFDKYSNAYVHMNQWQKLEMFFKGYFLAPPISCVNWLTQGYEYQYGKYTFRFLYAVLAVFFPNIEVVDTIQPFVYVDGVKSNVYTAIQWYAHDFGLLWVFIVEFILGICYGRLYSAVRKKNPSLFSIILLSMLMFPIINQFFDEKIFSIFSIWIQRIFALFLLINPGLCIRENGNVTSRMPRSRIRFKVRR